MELCLDRGTYSRLLKKRKLGLFAPMAVYTRIARPAISGFNIFYRIVFVCLVPDIRPARRCAMTVTQYIIILLYLFKSIENVLPVTIILYSIIFVYNHRYKNICIPVLRRYTHLRRN